MEPTEAVNPQIRETAWPPKPEFGEQPPNLQGSLISLILFVGLFLLLGMELRTVFILLLVLLLHELGHFTAMKQFGYKNVNMFFVPLFGAFVSGENEEASEGESVITILAGPVPGILVGLVLLYLEFAQGMTSLHMLPEVFLSLNILNLLPILPMDGGRLIETLFTRGKAVLENVFLFLSVLLVIGLAWVLNSIPALVIAAFIAIQIRKNLRTQKVRKWLQDQGFNLKTSYAALSNADYWQMEQALRRYLPGGEILAPGMLAIWIRNLIQPEPSQKLSWIARLGVVIFWLLCLLVPLWIYAWMNWAKLQGLGGEGVV